MATGDAGEFSENADAAYGTSTAPAFPSGASLDVTLDGLSGSRVRSGTARFNVAVYTCSMQLVSVRTAIAILWVSTVSMAGIAGNVSSFSSWTVLAAAGILPPLVMLQAWNEPRQSMSQSIREALG
jgi:hypothetical protein